MNGKIKIAEPDRKKKGAEFMRKKNKISRYKISEIIECFIKFRLVTSIRRK
jgi:hypothetical protein